MLKALGSLVLLKIFDTLVFSLSIIAHFYKSLFDFSLLAQLFCQFVFQLLFFYFEFILTHFLFSETLDCI